MTKVYTTICIDKTTYTLLVKTRGKLERQDGKKRSFDTVIRELAEKELTRLFE